MSHWPYLIITVKRAKRSYTELKFLQQKNIGFKKKSCLNDINLQNTLFVKLLVVGTAISRAFNPRMYTQIHTPTVVQGKRGLMEPLSCVFDMLQYFETI